MRFLIVDRTQDTEPPSGFVAALAAVLDRQAKAVASAWGRRRPTVLPAGMGQDLGAKVVLTDDADIADALGYHDYESGHPIAYVFVKTILDGGGTWATGPNSVSACASHETAEMLISRGANEWAFDNRGRLWATEACDQVQSDSYQDRDVSVSNWLRPAAFLPGARGPFDHMDRLSAPFTLAPGGYAIVASLKGETNVFADLGVATPPPDLPDAGHAVVVSGELPEWAGIVKADRRSRTMMRLAALRE